MITFIVVNKTSVYLPKKDVPSQLYRWQEANGSSGMHVICFSQLMHENISACFSHTDIFGCTLVQVLSQQLTSRITIHHVSVAADALNTCIQIAFLKQRPCVVYFL